MLHGVYPCSLRLNLDWKVQLSLSQSALLLQACVIRRSAEMQGWGYTVRPWLTSLRVKLIQLSHPPDLGQWRSLASWPQTPMFSPFSPYPP